MLMKQLMHACVLVLAVAFVAHAATEFEEEKDVLVLTDDNFDEAIATYKPLMVEFYAPWCGHCKQLAPEYAQAAKILKAMQPPIRIAKVDATANTKLAERFKIAGFPTIKFFKGDVEAVKDYDGGRTTDAITQWIIKRSGPAVQIVKDAKELEAIKEANEVVVFAVVDEEDGKARKTLERVADLYDEAAFVASVKTDLDADANAVRKVVLFKKFDEGKNVFEGKYVQRELLEFVRTNGVPLVITYTSEKAPVIFGGENLQHLITFMDLNANYREAMEEALKVPAKANKGKHVLHVIVPKTEAKINEYFGLKPSDLPAMILVNMTNGMKKYGFEFRGQELIDKIDEDLDTALIEFEKKYHAGELPPLLKSEDPVDDKDDAVKTIVGKQFDERVIKTTKDVLVEFYAPWCGHCKALAPKYEELAEVYADVDSIMIAKMDATANEVNHPDVNIKGFPTIMLFKDGDKMHAVQYDGPREVEALSSFLKDNCREFELDGEKWGFGVKKDEKKEEAKDEKKTDEHEEL